MLSFINMCSCTNPEKYLTETLKKHQIKALLVCDKCLHDDDQSKMCAEVTNFQQILDKADETESTSIVTPSSGTCTCSNESSLTSEECECVFEDNELQDELVKDVGNQKRGVELTLAILKPDAVTFRVEIERRIRNEGFQILQMRCLRLTPEQASEFYRDDYGKLDFPCIIKYITSGTIIVMVLAKHDAIHEWKRMIGPNKVSEARSYCPGTLRAIYGNIHEDVKNAIHGSENHKKAEEEIHFFFPDIVIEPVLADNKVQSYLWNNVNKILSKGLVEVMY